MRTKPRQCSTIFDTVPLTTVGQSNDDLDQQTGQHGRRRSREEMEGSFIPQILFVLGNSRLHLDAFRCRA